MPYAPAAGDLIWTGTPTGAGGHHNPPKWLKPGDVVEVELEGVGVLRNESIAPTTRTSFSLLAIKPLDESARFDLA